ncbi:TPA: choloylglycine hydrolase family protein [Serratia marcescens]|uniref:choloylglycine hydrolase family protein n=1 Tax=Serratia marcescens TaxID=615 RepID=UPI0009B2CDBF|nr:choloylglycine hydrolase family protein [Serratia marcescens]
MNINKNVNRKTTPTLTTRACHQVSGTLERLSRALPTTLASAVLTGLLAGAVVPAAEACTSLVLPTTDGSRIYARTLEFAVDTKSQLVGLPRHYALTGQKGLAWQSKYAAVGMNAYGMPALLDGMNEKGLTGGILWFPGFAEYTDPQAVPDGAGLAPWEFLTWALTNFATVAEVKAALPGIRVMSMKEPDMGVIPPVHYTLHDATGASIVIEPVNGELKVYDNPVGVMTNSPEFSWHLTNLRNYVNLTPVDTPALHINDAVVQGFGAGTGMHGLPGDQTPPSRFVRAAAMVLSAQKVGGGLPGVRMAEHIINNFDIPKGLVKQVDNKDAPADHTQWSTVADMGQDRYYIKTWDNPVLSGVGFTDFDTDGTTMVTFAIPAGSAPQTLTPVGGK